MPAPQHCRLGFGRGVGGDLMRRSLLAQGAIALALVLLSLQGLGRAEAARIVDLDASELAEGALASWANRGSAGGSFDMVLTGGAVVENVSGRNAVTFDGLKHRLASSFRAPASITGKNPFSVAVWAYDPKIDGEECLVCWAHRGADSRAAQLNIGTSKGSGAVTHWGDADMGYDGGVPSAGTWHLIILTYEGGTDGAEKVYLDGKLNAAKKNTLDLWSGDPIYFGSAGDEHYFSGSISAAQVYDYPLTEDEIAYLNGSGGVRPRAALVDLSAENLPAGPLERWENRGTLGGSFGLEPSSPRVGTAGERKCVLFDGSSWLQSSFDVPEALKGDSAFTVEVWALSRNWDNAAHAFLSAASGANGEELRFGLSAGYKDGAFASPRGRAGFRKPLPKPDTWRQIAYTYSGGKEGILTVYLDGGLNNQVKVPLAARSNVPLMLGASWQKGKALPYATLAGAISRLSVYDTELSQREIRNSMGLFSPFNPNPANDASVKGFKVTLAWTGGDPEDRSYDVYFGPERSEVEKADRRSKAFKGSVPAGDAHFGPIRAGLNTTYCWRVDAVSPAGKAEHRGTVWQFSTEIGRAANASPRTRISAVPVNTSAFSWTPGSYATSQAVYFGTDPDEVASGKAALARKLGAKVGRFKFPNSLEYGTTYYWRIDNENGRQKPSTGETWSFRTEDKPVKNDVTFFATTDLHYGASDTVADANRATTDFMNVLPGAAYPKEIGQFVGTPRGVIVTGDLANDGKPEQWQEFAKDYGLTGRDGRLCYPVYEGYGNHDGGLEPGKATAPAIIERNKVRPGLGKVAKNGLHYSWDWDQVHFVHTNLYPGDVRVKEGRLDGLWNEPQHSLEFLKEDLKENVGPSGRPVFVMLHYGFEDGFSDAWGWWSAPEREAFYQAIKDYNIVGILMGHTHAAVIGKWRGIDTFNIGSGQRDPDVGECFVFHITPTELTVAHRFSDHWGVVAKKPISGVTASSLPRLYRFENWNPLLALFRPYFLRSLTLGSRVRKPSLRRTGRISALTSSSALAMPWRTAPAWPVMPPPSAWAVTSYLPTASTASNGCCTTISSVFRPK